MGDGCIPMLQPYSLNRRLVLTLQQVYSHKTESPAPAVPLFPPLLPFGTISHLFLQGHFQSSKPCEGPGEKGSNGQQVTTHPLLSLPGHNHATPIPGEACSQAPHFSQSTKPVQQETGLPALTCRTNAALVRNISGKAEGPWNQSLSLGTYVQSRERSACRQRGSVLAC